MPYTWGPWVQLSDYTVGPDITSTGYPLHHGNGHTSGTSPSLATDQPFMDSAVNTARSGQHSIFGSSGTANLISRTSGNIPRGVQCDVTIVPMSRTYVPDLAPPDPGVQWPSDVPPGAVGFEFASGASAIDSGELDWYVGIRDDRNAGVVCHYSSDIYVTDTETGDPFGTGTYLTTVTDGPLNVNRYSLVDSGILDITSLMAANGAITIYNDYTAYTVTISGTSSPSINHIDFGYNPTFTTQTDTTASWVLTPPLVRFQFWTDEPAVFAAPPCHLYPRDDDQGVGTGAIWPPPSSGRPGSYY